MIWGELLWCPCKLYLVVEYFNLGVKREMLVNVQC